MILLKTAQSYWRTNCKQVKGSCQTLKLWAVDKTQNMEHSGTSQDILQHSGTSQNIDKKSKNNKNFEKYMNKKIPKNIE